MPTIPAQDLLSNIGTWAVSTCQAPAVARIITDAYPSEKFDPAFQGQDLETVYFDTRAFALRKARSRSDQYLTLRIRCYKPSGALGAGLPALGAGLTTPPTYALSAKTEGQKFRAQIDPNDAEAAISGNYTNLWPAALPGDLLARLLSIAGDDPLVPVVHLMPAPFRQAGVGGWHGSRAGKSDSEAKVFVGHHFAMRSTIVPILRATSSVSSNALPSR
jgi:hypothetical protein